MHEAQTALRPDTETRRDSSDALLRRVALPVVALAVCMLVYAFGVHMQRIIAFDEIGLHNPVYTFYTTGHMTYPMHGHPDFMVVHPPTHYAITAVLMKLGLPLFAASAAPLIALTAVLAAVIVTGPFSVTTGLGLLLGYFIALTTWSEFYTLRPDLHVTAAWFTALVVLESARLTGWAAWRLLLGTALAVLAATVHYWAISALLLPIFYLALAIWQRRSRLHWQVAAVTVGALAVGLPFLIWFVIPHYEPIMQMVAAVQGDGTPGAAYARHLLSYDAFAQRLASGWASRWLSSALASPALILRIPAIFLAVPLLAWRRETRALAFAAAVLPLFVLFLSQGKQIGYTGYFTPEFAMLFSGMLITLLALIDRFRPDRVRRSIWIGAAVIVISGSALTAVPTSMGSEWAWTARLEALDLERGAAKRISGPLVAITSAGVWYTGGGTYVWNAFNDLANANQRGDDATALLSGFDALILDTNWWNARHDLAPTGTWYAQGRLHLKGFVLPTTDSTRHMIQLFLARTPTEHVRGIFINGDDASEFVEDSDGTEVFLTLICPRTPRIETFTPSDYRFAFAYDRQPSDDSPSIVLIAVRSSDLMRLMERTSECRIRDARRGRTSRLPLNALRLDQAQETPISFFSDRSLALRAAGRAPMAQPVELDIPWDQVNLSPDGRRTTALPLEVVPPQAPWSYGAVIPFSVSGIPSEMTLRLDVVVTNTQAGFGVLTADRKNFLVRKFLEPSAESQTVELTIPPTVTTTGPLVIQNGARPGVGEIDVHGVTATLPAPVLEMPN